MENHRDLLINYNGRILAIKTQCLSKELPEIIYVVFPIDEELKKHFENIKKFYFHINSKLNKIENILEITHYVVYDYETEINQSKDVVFEFAVWNSLLKYDL